MDRTALNKSLHWSAKEATLGGHRRKEVFEQLDREEIELMEAVWASPTAEAYQAAWANLDQFFADKDAKLDTMFKWLTNSHEQVIGKFYDSKDKPSGTS